MERDITLFVFICLKVAMASLEGYRMLVVYLFRRATMKYFWESCVNMAITPFEGKQFGRWALRLFDSGSISVRVLHSVIYLEMQ